MTFQFQCPFCSALIEAGTLAPESEVTCPACGQSFVVEAPVQPVRVQAVAVPHPPSPSISAGHPGKPAVRRRVVTVKRPPDQSDTKDKIKVATLLVGAPLVFGGIIWGVTELRDATNVREKSAASELFSQARMGWLRYQEAAQVQERLEDTAWHSAHKAREAQQQMEEDARERQRREKLKQLFAKEFFDGDETLAAVAVDEFEAAELEVAGLYNDGIPGNEPRGGFVAAVAEMFAQRMIRRTEITSWIGERRLPDFARVPKQPGWLEGAQAKPDGVLATLLSGGYASTGTGFWVSRDGYMLTNEHVVGTATAVDLPRPGGGVMQAQVVKTSREKDLALLKVRDFEPEQWLRVTAGEPPLGRAVFTMGFPQPMIMGVAPKFEPGRISSLSGMQDNPDNYQITVALQPGNSGGPLIEIGKGWVVGVVASGLKPHIAEGNVVNYAIKASVVRGFIAGIPEAKSILDDTTNRILNAEGEEKAIDRAQKAVAIVLVK